MRAVDLSPERKTYGQQCPMATALDFVGDRWTILIVRELLGGPGRFQELKSGLPGIASNLLSDRLRRMESDGIVRRVDVGGSAIYALTESGAGIRTAIEELGIWGARMGCRIGPAVHERSIRAIAMALQALLARADTLPTDVNLIELETDGQYSEIMLGPKPTVTARPASHADASVTASASDLSAFLAGEIGADVAFQHISGDRRATRRLIAALSFDTSRSGRAV